MAIWTYDVATWLSGHMVTWLYGCMALWLHCMLYGHIWLHGDVDIWLSGYMTLRRIYGYGWMDL